MSILRNFSLPWLSRRQRFSNMRRFVLSILLACAALVASAQDLKLPSVLGSGMVLQQNENVNIWGWAKPSANISVEAQWLDKAVKTNADVDGKWIVTIPTPAASYNNYTLSISDGKKKINLVDVLIGEVWLCSGQSNMAWKTELCLDLKEEMEDAANVGKHVRLFTTGRIRSDKPEDDVADARWTGCTPETVASFSGVGYGFGIEIQKALDVPVGLLQASYGGTFIEGWVSQDAIHNGEKSATFTKGVNIIDKGKTMWVGKASHLYNANIHPLLNVRIAGVIWYQGCTNVKANPVSYRDNLQGLIRSWRKEFDNPDMPFYIAQIAPHTYVNQQGALLRESQDFVAATEPGCELVVTNDGQEIPGDVHPRLKKNVCHRFALCALGHHYKKDVGQWRSPAYEKMQVNGSEVIVSFKNLPTVFQVRGEMIIGFQIGEKKADGTVRYALADARLDESGKNVILSSDQIKNPSDVRYCFDESVGNVFSAEGLPLAPFRTDTKNKPLSKSARAYIEPAVKTPIVFEGEGYQKVTFEEGAKFWTDSEMTLFKGSYPQQFEGFDMLIAEGVDKGEKSKGGKIIAKEDGRIYFISPLAKDLKKNWYKPGWRVIMPSEIELTRVIGQNSDGTPKYKTIGSLYISYLDVKAGQEVELPVTENWLSVIPLASSIDYVE